MERDDKLQRALDAVEQDEGPGARRRDWVVLVAIAVVGLIVWAALSIVFYSGSFQHG